MRGLRGLERRELTWLVVGIGACTLLLLFLFLTSEVVEGDTLSLDTKIVRALRSPDDPSKPIGPAWVESMLIDLTSLGGPAVLGLFVTAIAGFLLLQGRTRTAIAIVITSLSGELVGEAMKYAFHRPRPTVVPHLRQVFSTSFPSGHAMESAIVYLTLGAMLMRVADRRATKLYILAVAMLLTVIVGVSRVWLGVHYPTDVIGGWMIGLVWASVCWLATQRVEARAGIDAERAKSE